MNKIKEILVGTPVADQQITLPYFNSVRRLEQQFAGICAFSFHFPQSSILAFSRNAIATIFLRDPNYSHLLFIDSDMSFEPSLFTKMIEADKPIVGCVPPAKHFDLDAFHSNSRRFERAEQAAFASQHYLIDDHVLETRGDLARVRYTGTGILLIKREVLDTMSGQFPELWTSASDYDPYSAFGISGSVFQCFASVKNREQVYFAEDMSFCLRWTEKCHGELWVVTNEPIGHLGRMNFFGNYSQRFGSEPET